MQAHSSFGVATELNSVLQEKNVLSEAASCAVGNEVVSCVGLTAKVEILSDAELLPLESESGSVLQELSAESLPPGSEAGSVSLSDENDVCSSWDTAESEQESTLQRLDTESMW